MTCSHCARHLAQQTAVHVSQLTAGVFDAGCASCCARLVRSARPLRPAQEAMMAAITRRDGRPTREQIIQAIGHLDAWSA